MLKTNVKAKNLVKSKEKTYELTVSGIKVTIVEKRGLKHYYIKVIPPKADLQIHVPAGTTIEELALVVNKRMEKINQMRQEILSKYAHFDTSYDSGQICYLWGKSYELVVEYLDDIQVGTNKSATAKHAIYLRENVVGQGQIVMRLGAKLNAKQRKVLLQKWYRHQLSKALPDVLQHAQQIVGVQASECRIKRMRTKWGTCNIAHKRVWINLSLVEKPKVCLEYVVFHELCHLHEARHNKRFYKLLEHFYPDYKQAKSLLESFNRTDVFTT